MRAVERQRDRQNMYFIFAINTYTYIEKERERELSGADDVFVNNTKLSARAVEYS